MQQQQQAEQMKLENENQQRELDRQNRLEVATINATWNDKLPEDFRLDREKLKQEKEIADDKIELERDKLKVEERVKDKEVQVKKSLKQTSKPS